MTSIQLDTVVDEKILDDDVKCEMTDVQHRPIPCSVEATHVFTACWVEDAKICEKLTQEIVRLHGDKDAHCIKCGQRCWSWRPI